MGECTEGRLAHWIEDVRAADREVVARSGATRVTWVGLRLGATLALLAADRDPGHEVNLVVWDPVLSGANYLNVFRWKPGRVARSRGIRALDSMQELVGFEISPELRREIEAIDLGAERRILSRSVTVLGDQPAEEYAKLRAVVAASGREARYVPIEPDAPWDSEEALNASTIPARTLDALLAAVENPA